MMNCPNCKAVMTNLDDLNFLCRRCGHALYRADKARERQLMRPPPDGRNARTCPVCGRIAVRNDGGYTCMHCSASVGQMLDAGATVRLVRGRDRVRDPFSQLVFFSMIIVWAVCMLAVTLFKFVLG